MPKLTAKIANQPVTDESGYCKGIIKNILLTDETNDKKGNKYVSQFEFLIQSEGTRKPIDFKFWVGQNINSQKFEGQYNRLTTLLLAIGEIKESELDTISETSTPDLSKLIGKQVKFKIEPSKKKRGLHLPVLETFELLPTKEN